MENKNSEGNEQFDIQRISKGVCDYITKLTARKLVRSENCRAFTVNYVVYIVMFKLQQHTTM